MTIPAPISAYLYESTLRGHRPATTRLRGQILRRLARHLDPTPIAEATRAEVESWYRTFDRHARETRRQYGVTARVFYGWLIDHEVRPDNPAARLPIPTIPRAKPRPLPLDEVRAILDGATDPMMGAWVRLGLFAGLRVGEIARLCREDIDDLATPPVLHVVNGKGGKDRSVIIGPALVDALRPFFVRRRGSLWGDHPLHVPRRMRAFFDAIDLPHVVPHHLRHTYASQLYRESLDLRLVQEHLGHASPTTTAIYAAPSSERAARAVLALEAGYAA